MQLSTIQITSTMMESMQGVNKVMGRVNEQMDIKSSSGEMNGLTYAIELSKKIEEIKWIKLKHNHRSDLVGKILEHEYGKK